MKFDDISKCHILYIQSSKIMSINLDVTALIALVSEISHCSPKEALKIYSHLKEDKTFSPIYNQIEQEQYTQVLAQLHLYMRYSKLYVSLSTFQTFMSILNQLGGTTEKTRVVQAKNKDGTVNSFTIMDYNIVIVEDCLSEQTKMILEIILKSETNEQKIQAFKKNLLTFGTGQAMKCPTLTSNRQFAKMSQKYGFMCDIIYHESRSLSLCERLKLE